MAQRPVVAHAMMVTGDAGQVVTVSLAFAGSSAPAASTAFRQQFGTTMTANRRTFGDAKINFRNGADNWFVEFANGCDERTLGSVLKMIASSMNISIFIDPSISKQDLLADPLRFYPTIDPRRDRPSN